jgi:hypothetical protein
MALVGQNIIRGSHCEEGVRVRERPSLGLATELVIEEWKRERAKEELKKGQRGGVVERSEICIRGRTFEPQGAIGAGICRRKVLRRTDHQTSTSASPPGGAPPHDWPGNPPVAPHRPRQAVRISGQATIVIATPAAMSKFGTLVMVRQPDCVCRPRVNTR